MNSGNSVDKSSKSDTGMFALPADFKGYRVQIGKQAISLRRLFALLNSAIRSTTLGHNAPHVTYGNLVTGLPLRITYYRKKVLTGSRNSKGKTKKRKVKNTAVIGLKAK